MKQKITTIILLMAAFAGLTSCNEDNDPVIAQYLEIVDELPTYYKLNSQNTLIHVEGNADTEIKVLNSTDEVRSYISEDFLAAYPDYLAVDFSQYSLLVKTAPVFPYVINTSNTNFSIIYNPYKECWQLTEEIFVSDTLEKDWYVERVALVIEKVPSDTKFTCTYNQKTQFD